MATTLNTFFVNTGTTSFVQQIYIEGTDGTPFVGLIPGSSSGLKGRWIPSGQSVTFILPTGTNHYTWQDPGAEFTVKLAQIDGTNAPGWYSLMISNLSFARGFPVQTMTILGVSGMSECNVQLYFGGVVAVSASGQPLATLSGQQAGQQS